MLSPGEQNARQNHNTQMDDKSYDNVAKLESVGTTLTNQELQA